MSNPSVRVTRPQRRRSPLGTTIFVLGAIVVAVLILAQVWTEVLWFDQLGFIEVLRTEWLTRGALFVAGAALMAAAVWSSLAIGYRTRPVYAPTSPEQVNLDQYREAVEPLRRLVMVAGPAVLGFFAGVAASQQWETIQLWLNQVPFGETDPQFGLDLSFFVFTLPGLRFIVSFLMAVVVLAGIVALATHYLYGGLRATGGSGERTTRQARIHLATLGTIFMLLVAANQWLDRYSLLTKSGAAIDGATYADVNAVMPSKAILTGVAVLVAIMFAIAAVRGTWRLPAIGVGLMVVSAVVIGGIYPAIVQRFQVTPNAQELEREFYQRNIDATLKAYGLEDVETTPYEAKTEAVAGALANDAEPTASIRLLDPTIVSNSFRQLQQNKQYYNFADSLAVDRYVIDGQSRDTVIAARELNLEGLGSRSWVIDHTVYTHGFGVVAAFGNTTTVDGQPAFYERDIPSRGELGDYEPRIYFGQNSPTYSIVGAPEGRGDWELDYPDDAAGGQVNTTFPTREVSAGPWIRDPWTRLLYALKFGDEEIVFSDRVTSESQILYDRDPRLRVGKVAPYLTLDQRVYPAVVDGRIKWIVDGYTTTDAYPYSTARSLDEAVADSLTRTSEAIPELLPEMVNYIRNSVKATVDAYDGSVTLYAWDTEDPILKAWANIFDNSLTPMSEISGDLMSHFRYPEDLFKVQRELLSRYHVDDATEFYSGQDFWKSPDDPVRQGNILQPPYYLTLKMPGQDEATFSLTSSYIPGGTTDRNVLTGFLAVDAETGSTPGKVREGYGKLRLLELPRNSTVPGPGQVQNIFNSDPSVSQALNLLRQGQSNVINGNLLTLPVGGGLLYVQPVYVQASEGTRFPLLQKVLVAFGDKVGFADTLDEALDQVFEGDSGADAGDADNDIPGQPVPPEAEPTDPPATDPPATDPPATDPPATDPPATDPPATDPPAGDARAELEAALQAAAEAMREADAALKAGDFAAYGAAQDKLAAAIDRALAAEAALEG